LTRPTRPLWIALAAIVIANGAPVAADQIVDRERSLYQNILVVDRNGRRCLQFTLRETPRNQSCKDLDTPERLVFIYARMMLASLLVLDDPHRILMIGLGGGTLPQALARLYPEVPIDIVEIDPAVVRVATAYFDFTPSPQMQIFVQDARVWGKRAATSGTRYDLIMLDAFNGDYIPEHMMTLEYLQETRALLTDRGVLAANTFATSDLYDHESTTYARAFGRIFNLKMPETSNRIIIASRAPLPDRAALDRAAQRLAPRLAPLGMNALDYPPHMSTRADWRADARLLTDQYSPANLLREQHSN
jgi:spermidine synthase